jgi:2-succinyl-6-hydroxy-2,4-cyclohexadiene-1-carboxylate synthase
LLEAVHLNGLDFHVEIEGHGPPLLLLHGFTGGACAWDSIRSVLAVDATVVALDLIGHGQSARPADPARYTFEWATRDLLGLLDALHLPTVDLLGYSMGGRVALHFALEAPDRVRSLLLESASPGIDNPAERQARAASDDALAERVLREGVPAFVAEWEQQALLALAPHVSDDVRRRQRELRLANDPIGLANSLRGMGAGRQQPLWSRLNDLAHVPVCLVVGERDSRYCAIAQRIQAAVPSASLEVVPGAGHTVHLDQPEQFARLVKKLTQASTRCYIGSERLF